MRKSNKGFSLVELIIVIAIMAVLIAVLAPQYLQYVEKSKKSADATTVGEVFTAAETAMADPSVDKGSTNPVTVTVTGSTGAYAANVTAVTDAVKSVVGDSTVTLKSKMFTADNSVITFTYDSSTSAWTKSYSGPYADFEDAQK